MKAAVAEYTVVYCLPGESVWAREFWAYSAADVLVMLHVEASQSTPLYVIATPGRGPTPGAVPVREPIEAFVNGLRFFAEYAGR